jgi:hypothetical protein
VLDDAARRRFVVVRSDDEEAVHADFVRALCEVDRVGRRVGPRARDDGRAVPHLVHRGRPQIDALVV